MNKPCDKFSSCPHYAYYAFHFRDDPTKANGLGWRCAFSLLGYIILGKGVTTDNSFFTALVLFALPLLIDYSKFVPATKGRLYLRWAGLLLSGLWGFIGAVGLFGVLLIQNINETLYISVSHNFIAFQGFGFPLVYLWYIMISSVVLTVFDWMIYRTNIEKDYKQGVMS